MEIWYLVAHMEQTTRPALALRLPCPTGPDVHLCASDHCTLRSNSPYRLIIRTAHCTQTLVYSSMLCVAGVVRCVVSLLVVYALTCLSVCQMYANSLSQELGLSTVDDSGLIVLPACMRYACTCTHIHTHTPHYRV